MDTILTKATQSADDKKKEKISYIEAIILMAVFTALFLGTEYLFVDILSFMISENKTVLAQNYALGASAAGFVLYPLFHRFCTERMKTVCFIIMGLISVVCAVRICLGTVYTDIFIAGLILFLLLGLLGSGVFYRAVCMLKTDQYLAGTVGISYALGIMLQFACNNLIRSKIAEAVTLSVFLILLVALMVRSNGLYCKQEEHKTEIVVEDKKEGSNKIGKGTIIGALLILLVVLMTCIFSTLDNAVTLVHSGRVMDIGQAPRILLALSGLVAGFVFDIKNRKYAAIVMYCVMVLSAICIAILKFAGPFLAGLIAFYLSAGFFAVFFTYTFMEISRHMKVPKLWAGMGRAVNNITAAIIAYPVLTLLSEGSSLSVVILVLILFVAVSIVAIAYTFQKNQFMDQLAAKDIETDSRAEKLRRISDEFSFTEREAEVFASLIGTEDSIQTIAENLYISKRTLERYISAIYEKTGVKSRVGLINIYNRS